MEVNLALATQKTLDPVVLQNFFVKADKLAEQLRESDLVEATESLVSKVHIPKLEEILGSLLHQLYYDPLHAHLLLYQEEIPREQDANSQKHRFLHLCRERRGLG